MKAEGRIDPVYWRCTYLWVRVDGTLKDRTRSMRGLGSNKPGRRFMIHTIKNVLAGWDVHYNFVRPHEALDGKTPAEVAGVGMELNDGWGELIEKAIKHKTRMEKGQDFWETIFRLGQEPIFQ